MDKTFGPSQSPILIDFVTWLVTTIYEEDWGNAWQKGFEYPCCVYTGVAEELGTRISAHHSHSIRALLTGNTGGWKGRGAVCESRRGFHMCHMLESVKFHGEDGERGGWLYENTNRKFIESGTLH